MQVRNKSLSRGLKPLTIKRANRIQFYADQHGLVNAISPPLVDQVLLESLDLTSANTWYRNSALGIAIYEKNEDTWSFVGKSAWQASTAIEKNTFTFSDRPLRTR